MQESMSRRITFPKFLINLRIEKQETGKRDGVVYLFSLEEKQEKKGKKAILIMTIMLPE